MKKHVAITIDADLVELVYKMSYKEGRSFSNQVNRILRMFFNKDSDDTDGVGNR